MLFTISAIRSDGLECAGTIDANNEHEAMKQARRTFPRQWRVKGRITGCSVEGHNPKVCALHRGEIMSFSKVAARKLEW